MLFPRVVFRRWKETPPDVRAELIQRARERDLASLQVDENVALQEVLGHVAAGSISDSPLVPSPSRAKGK